MNAHPTARQTCGHHPVPPVGPAAVVPADPAGDLAAREKPKNARGPAPTGRLPQAEKYALLASFCWSPRARRWPPPGPTCGAASSMSSSSRVTCRACCALALLMLGVYGAGAVTHYAMSWVMAGVSQRPCATCGATCSTSCRCRSAIMTRKPHGEICEPPDQRRGHHQHGDVHGPDAAHGRRPHAGDRLDHHGLPQLAHGAGLAGDATLTALLTRFISRHTGRVPAAAGRPGRAQRRHRGDHYRSPVIKSMGREDSAIAQFNEANAELRKAATTAQAYSSVMGPMST